MKAKRDADLPWVDRHRPKHLGQVVGNTQQIRKLAEWLRDWDDVVLHGKTKEVPVPQDKGGGKGYSFYHKPDNLNARAALISGPPGIGKTTTVTLLAKCNPKYSCKQYNASDARSKKIVEEMSKSLAGNMTLRMGAGSKSALERSCIIMDECDGMAGGDAGGMQALINMIKTTKNPIICICNDRSDRAVKDLAQVCLDIRFQRPENAIVAKRMKAILEGEGKKADVVALEAIVEACGHDIRQVLNQVQFFGTATAYSQGSQKDTQLMVTPFDACAKLLTQQDKSKRATPMSFSTKMDMFFIDADFMPLLLQENYLRAYEKSTRTLEAEDISRCAYAADLIATSDVMNATNDFGLVSSAAAIGTIYPAFLMSAEGNFSRPSFPTYLQKFSTLNSSRRNAQAMYSRVKPFTTVSRKDIPIGYLDLLHRRLLRPLIAGDVKGCAVLMHSHGLERDFFTDQAPAMRDPLKIDDGYKKVDGKYRSQLLEELKLLFMKKNDVKKTQYGGSKRPAAEGDEVEDDGENTAAKKQPAKKKPKKIDVSKMSLGGWVKHEPKLDADGKVIPAKVRKTGILLKFIEGHTNAVRRQVHFDDITGPWTAF
jgi:replication factor C subunit 1